MEGGERDGRRTGVRREDCWLRGQADEVQKQGKARCCRLIELQTVDLREPVHSQRLRPCSPGSPALVSSLPPLHFYPLSLFVSRPCFRVFYTTLLTTLVSLLRHYYNSPNMVHVKASLLALSALASQAYAAAASVNTPTSLIQCQPYQLSK